MKHKLLIGCLALLVCLPAYAERPVWTRSKTQTQATALDTESWIAVNKILMFVTNQGGFANQAANTLGKSDGLYFPFTSVEDITSGVNDNSVIFAAGVWMGGEDAATGDTLTVVAEFSNEYFPGPMTDSTFTDSANILPQYRIYRLYKDSMESNPNSDYTNWPTDQGAPVDSLGKPALLGDEMLWCVYTDANPATKTNDASSTLPIGVEVRQSIFAFDRAGELGNVVFMRFRIYNKGVKTLNNFFISLWADPDLGGASDDFVGCDIPTDLGYCYNATNNDNDYGSKPPAVGFDFFQGPMVDSVGQTAKMWGVEFPDKANLGMTSFNKYINGTDPQNFVWTYQYMNGLDASNGGAPLPNGTKYAFPGDPVTGTGDLDFAPADRRWMQTTGPISFAPGDSTEIYAAVVVGQGASRLSSITALRFIDSVAQEAFDADFVLPEPPAVPVLTAQELDGTISIQWTDTSEVDPGDFPFEGYTVYQGASASGPWTLLVNHDLVNDITVINELAFDFDIGLPLVKPTKFGNDGGIQRFFGTTLDAVNSGSLSNLTTYFFKVEAYSLRQTLDTNTGVTVNKTLTSSAIVQLTPEQPATGGTDPFTFGDIIPAIHTTGGSDGVVAPDVINAEALNGHKYQVSFEDTVMFIRMDTSIDASVTPPDTTIDSVFVNVAWHLNDLTSGQRIFEYMTNQTGDDNYPIIDGFKIIVSGPSIPGVKPSDMFATNDRSKWGWDIPSGTRRFTWANADGFEWEGFRGAIGWGGPGDTHGFGNAAPIAPGQLVNVLLVLAQVDTLGVFDSNDTNVSYAYRYGRGFTGPPAQPDFAQHMINTTDGGYRFQDFEKSCPISAWNIDVNPPQRLAVGYLENNATNGLVDGKYFPGSFSDYNNIAGDGPREWLWIYLDDYSETSNSAYTGDAIGDPMPVMYWLTVNRRGNVPFSPGATGEDQFQIIPGKINTVADSFTFVATAQSVVASGSENLMDRIRAVPNPYYLQSAYDNSVVERRMKFSNLPEKCTIKIFTLGGDLVASVDHDDPNQSFEEWNVESSNGIPIASGIYIYVVESDAFGNKIGKMAIFTEEEQLNTF